MNFKEFLETAGVDNSGEVTTNYYNSIINILSQMDQGELSDFGAWLYDSMFSDDAEDIEDADDVEDIEDADDAEDVDDIEDIEDYDVDDDYDFTLPEIKEMLNLLEVDDLKYVYEQLISDVDDEDDNQETPDISERKFFKKKKVQLFRDRKKNLIKRKLDAKKRKLYYRKHKGKIKLKQKLYRKKVKRNPNKVKIHR